MKLFFNGFISKVAVNAAKTSNGKKEEYQARENLLSVILVCFWCVYLVASVLIYRPVGAKYIYVKLFAMKLFLRRMLLVVK